MTDKQILVDGVDVSGCELYRDDNGVFAPDGTAERTELCYLTNDYCGNNPNCYYKQLKAKEQECEKLKEKCRKYGEINEQETKDYAELKAENKELKRYKSLFEKARDLRNEASKTNYKLLVEIEDLKDSLKRTICQSECYRYKEAEKLKQTFTEIKEIAEENDELLLGYHKEWVNNKIILEKINEVEDV